MSDDSFDWSEFAPGKWHGRRGELEVFATRVGSQRDPHWLYDAQWHVEGLRYTRLVRVQAVPEIETDRDQCGKTFIAFQCKRTLEEAQRAAEELAEVLSRV